MATAKKSGPSGESSQKDSSKVYGGEGRLGGYMRFKPENLLIAETGALHDKERHNMPLNEAMVLNIMAHGVKRPADIWKDPETGKTYVVDGRRRRNHCIEANKRLKKEGLPEHEMRCIVVSGKAATAVSVMTINNLFGEEETSLGLAEKMQANLDQGRTEEEIVNLTGKSIATVKNLIKLNSAPACVKSAVRDGVIKVTAAYKLAGLEPGAAKERLDSLANKKGKARKFAEKEIVTGGVAQLRKKKEVNALRAKLTDKDSASARIGLAFVAWFMGDDKALAEVL